MRKIILASKQTGYIYHLTNTEADYSILREDTLGVKILNYDCPISFTRNPKYNAISGKWDDTPSIKFVVDGNKLSTRYKIKPYSDITSGFGGRFEREEVVMGPIKNLSKYLVGIQIMRGFKAFKELRIYLDKHPHIKIFGILAPSLLKSRLKEVEGWWYKNKHIPDIGHLLSTHRDFSDYEPIDIGYISSKMGPDADTILAHPELLYVSVDEHSSGVSLDVIYNPEDASGISKFINLISEISGLPEIKITKRPAVSEYDGMDEDNE